MRTGDGWARARDGAPPPPLPELGVGVLVSSFAVEPVSVVRLVLSSVLP